MIPLKSGVDIVTFRYRVVTPMFLGGADAIDKPELRSASIKGVLRFWWRALNWYPVWGQSGKDEIKTLKELHKREAFLFGNATDSDKSTCGQGCFLFRISQIEGIKTGKPDCNKYSARSYMLGQGLFDKTVTREAILAGEFSLEFIFKPGTSAVDRRSVLDAAYIFGLLGGLGSRTRRGWGSVSLIGIEGTDEMPGYIVQDISSYIDLITKLCYVKQDSIQLPPYSAITPGTKKWSIGIKKQSSIDVIDEVGKRMGLFRGFGHAGKVFGINLKKANFVSDHNLMLEAAKGNIISKSPERLIFGMPHNYFFSSEKGAKVNIQKTHPNKLERRASPLFIHIHPVGDSFTCVQFVLKSVFLPKEEELCVDSRKGNSTVKSSISFKTFSDYFEFVQTFTKIYPD